MRFKIRPHCCIYLATFYTLTWSEFESEGFVMSTILSQGPIIGWSQADSKLKTVSWRDPEMCLIVFSNTKGMPMGSGNCFEYRRSILLVIQSGKLTLSTLVSGAKYCANTSTYWNSCAHLKNQDERIGFHKYWTEFRIFETSVLSGSFSRQITCVVSYSMDANSITSNLSCTVCLGSTKFWPLGEASRGHEHPQGSKKPQASYKVPVCMTLGHREVKRNQNSTSTSSPIVQPAKIGCKMTCDNLGGVNQRSS